MFERPTRRQSRAAGRARLRRRRPRRTASSELHELAASAGAVVVGTVTGRRARPDPAYFAGSGKVDEIDARRRETARRPRDLRPRALRRAAAQPRGEARVPRRRPREPHPRHLRAARTQRGGQAAGRARAARASFDAPRRRLDPPRAAEGRHRLARPGRNAARDRPPPDRPARQGAARAHRARGAQPRRAKPHPPARRGAHGRARRLYQRRQVDAVQPADRRTARSPPTSCSPRSTPRCARSRAGRARRSCCRTPSASSATCRTTWSRRSASTLTEAADADLLLHVIDGSSLERDVQERRWTRCSRRSARPRCRGSAS